MASKASELEMEITESIERKRIVSEKEAERITSLTRHTLRRICANGGKLRRIQLTQRRAGYRLGELLDFLETLCAEKPKTNGEAQ